MTKSDPKAKKNLPFRRPQRAGEETWATHIIRETENYVLEGYIYATRRLIITFEYASQTLNAGMFFAMDGAQNGFVRNECPIFASSQKRRIGTAILTSLPR
ncbi:MAG: hypothetical protein P8Q26_13935 [Ascidiaceihabitans sp.]|nr:hypothetical protein [Ascidiaceihabitans sp.]